MEVSVPDRRYGILAWTVVWATIVVISGGSVVRATGSGAGCGRSWPRCEGSFFPLESSVEMLVEFAHRATTVVLAVLLIGLIVWTVLITRKGNLVRKALAWSSVFFVGEVLIGALLVLFGWVDDDVSLARLVMVPLHLVNTLFLLGAMTVTAHCASHALQPRSADSQRRGTLVLVFAGIGIFILITVTGVLNALADTLFPVDTLLDGWHEELGAAPPFLVRIRAIHPIIAIVGGLSILVLVRRPAFDPYGRARRQVAIVAALIFFQFLVGLINVAMATPVAIQVAHLFIADVLWVVFVLASTRVLFVPEGTTEHPSKKALR